jgi:hypothetical protein
MCVLCSLLLLGGIAICEHYLSFFFFFFFFFFLICPLPFGTRSKLLHRADAAVTETVRSPFRIDVVIAPPPLFFFFWPTNGVLKHFFFKNAERSFNHSRTRGSQARSTST